ncbi:tetratricopeptide repeat protein [Desulfosarcina cetonica]|uniref:tetratricopeptide repeat protein n=1 Tax=Desulfosarcina cetonica TaxID=90730 RepID=UPI00155DDC51|nr:tetratricopeptide repeat protein [Desulfosarcina cetonica]
MRRNAPGRAIDRLTTALGLTPDDALILGELGTAYYLQGNLPKAMALLNTALSHNPTDAQSRYYLELAMRKQNGERPAADAPLK